MPPGSPLAASLTIPWIGGGASTGGHLYRQITPAVTDTLYVRFYIKYPTVTNYTHSGVWMGGYNPPLAWLFNSSLPVLSEPAARKTWLPVIS